MSSRASALSILALAATLGACASTGGQVSSVAPSTTVALADYNDTAFRAITIADVTGAAPPQDFFEDLPWSDKRIPSHGAVRRLVSTWLSDADMLAPDATHARYLLKISLEGAPQTQPAAAAPAKDAAPAIQSVTYALVDARTSETVLEKTFAANPDAGSGATSPASPPLAPRALIAGSFNEFLVDMSKAEMVRMRRAVPCDMIDPARGLGPAVIRKTTDAVGVDCPI